jgi:hypothetical protein
MSDTTTVNVKNIRVDAWSAAKLSAERSDESLGSWVSRACDQLAAAEAGGQRLIPPPERLNQVAKVANPALPDRLAQLATLAHIARELTPEGKDSRAAQMARRAVCAELALLAPPFQRLTQPPRAVGGEAAIVPGGEELHHAVEITDIGD